MRVGRRIGQGDRYGLLLATLITVYLVSAFASSRVTQVLQVTLFVAITLLALRVGTLPRRVVVVARWVTMTGSAIAIALVAASGNKEVRGAASLWTAALLLLTVMIIVEQVLRMNAVTIQSIYAALSAYMIIGLMFASVYAAIDSLTTADFFVNGQPADIRTFQYFSFTTLTTLGYGDFTAAGNFGRALAVLEAMTGQIFLATLVARLVAAFRAPPRGEPPSTGPAGPAGEGEQPPDQPGAGTRRG
jgi:Ion channel